MGEHTDGTILIEREADARLIAAAPTMYDFIASVAGGDCHQYDKHLNPKPCGTCQSCRARALVALVDGAPASPEQSEGAP